MHRFATNMLRMQIYCFVLAFVFWCPFQMHPHPKFIDTVSSLAVRGQPMSILLTVYIQLLILPRMMNSTIVELHSFQKSAFSFEAIHSLLLYSMKASPMTTWIGIVNSEQEFFCHFSGKSCIWLKCANRRQMMKNTLVNQRHTAYCIWLCQL